MSNKKVKMLFVASAGIALTAIGFAVGYSVNEKNFSRAIIDSFELGNNHICIEDSRTGLLYDITAECIGD